MSIAVSAPGPRMVVTSPGRTRSGVPGSRPAPGPMARPVGTPSPGRTRSAVACTVQPRPSNPLLLRVKVGAVAALALLGLGASAAEFATWTAPDPAVEYVQGDPAWAHVSTD